MKNILAKIAKGETLTDAEKETVSKFDLQAEIDKAASGARKKAEAEAKAKREPHCITKLSSGSTNPKCQERAFAPVLRPFSHGLLCRWPRSTSSQLFQK